MMTLSGAWHKLRDDPILRFLVVSLAFYGMSTFEGPMITIGSLYHLIPRLYGRAQMHSIGLINAHFWLATIGTVLYIASMWVNGITQGLMWRTIRVGDARTTEAVPQAVAHG